MTAPHIPVMLTEVLTALSLEAGQTCIDATFGGGSYSRAILTAVDCRVVAIDRDPGAIAAGRALELEFAPRLSLVEGRFSELARIAAGAGHRQVDCVVLDIGVSSMQLDVAERGFSFQADGPLDMRMSASGGVTGDGPSAASVVNDWDEGDLADIVFHLGEERHSRRIARAVVRARETAPLTRTSELARVVAGALPRRKDGRNPATQTFQALRIFVNDELGELATALSAAEQVLAPGGRLVIVTFHSLEDRIVKQFLAARSGRLEGGSRHLPPRAVPGRAASFRIVNPRGLTPDESEIAANPRARSARLRTAIRTEAPAWPEDTDIVPGPRLA